ncbi:MAG TPA: type II toxin-antitoxin system Phd/YefM family antitoxin [Ramlibacter sp.]|uniref:type II toxin-antitoxin system Phd/YefM family antitoxin n=1 Tax=Ramlibacter sp. TaxID=1917967 RepID=UPI002D7FDB4A|nr:type II toxin-antitoxin system Phd/YefM family antitoxin [Ramlibacter sp.]HET8745515.1 type II toxin-antitoxin system Phd/YefM family antitoxin [Ramlibacter sp.]
MTGQTRITRLTSREFNQDTARAKKAAAEGPVVITDRGEPSHVLMTYERYRELTEGRSDIVTLLGMAADEEIEFDPPKASGLTKPVGLG